METTCKTPAVGADAAPEIEADIDANDRTDRKIRLCLMCGQAFPSEWAGERICKACKSTTVWRTG